jgi:hypothetical protein
MVRRNRTLAAVVCLAASVALGALWVRSYQVADRLQGRIWFSRSFVIGAKQGRLAVVTFRQHVPPDPEAEMFLVNSGLLVPNRWVPVTASYPAKDEMSFPVGDARQYDSAVGFGLLRQPAFMVTRSTFQTPLGGTVYISGSASARLNGWGVSVPIWFLVLTSGALGVALCRERPWRLSMRGMFVAVTVIAVVLGLVVAFDKPPQNWELDEPVPLDGL